MSLSRFVTYPARSGWGIGLAVFVVAGALGLLCSGSSAFAAMSSSVRAASSKPADPEGPDRLLQTASLKAFDAAGAVSFGPLAVSGSTVVATGGDYEGVSFPNNAGGDPAAYVFTEPVGEWQSEAVPAAILEPSNDEDLSSIAMSGNIIAAGANGIGTEFPPSHPGSANPDGGGDPAVYVFTEPAGGWSGLIHESATLKPSPGASYPNIGASVAISSNTVLASANQIGNAGATGVVYVFNEPAGGWSGTVYPSATLTDSNGAALGSVQADGSTITTGYLPESGNASVDVFIEPAGGWSGTIAQTARTSAVGLQGVSGKTILTQSRPSFSANVTNEPAGGWSGTVAPSATFSGLPISQDVEGPVGGAISGSVATIVSEEPDNKVCPCAATVAAFDKPAGGWSGSYRPSAQTPTDFSAPSPTVVEYGSIGISGQAILVGGEGEIDIYTKAAVTQLPSASQTSVTGLAKRKPRLTFRLTAGQKSQSLQAFTIRLPAGLHFNRRTLTRNLRLAGHPRYKVTESSRAVTVTLRAALRSIAVTISANGLGADSALLRAAKRLASETRAQRRKHTISLKLTVSTIDAAGAPSSLTLHPNAT